MKAALPIVACGATTPVGLTAAQTCAAIRARVSGFERVAFLAPPADPVSVARIPSSGQLKRAAATWLANLAERALRECMSELLVRDAGVALVIAVPDSHRTHASASGVLGAMLLGTLQTRLNVRFHRASQALTDGHASAIKGIAVARHLFATTDVDLVIVGGVDSLLNRQDIGRLHKTDRLYCKRNPQGVIPGEGAGFIALSRPNLVTSARPLAQVLGVGVAIEADTILGERFSTGTGLQEALKNAEADSAHSEATYSFRISDMNGERYRAWESLVCSTRYYRTRREHMPVWYPASSVGDLGAAAGAIALIVGAIGMSRGYAPGPCGMCEASSDEGLRAACVIGSAPDSPALPFRSRPA